VYFELNDKKIATTFTKSRNDSFQSKMDAESHFDSAPCPFKMTRFLTKFLNAFLAYFLYAVQYIYKHKT